jgi:hypothetical protein
MSLRSAMCAHSSVVIRSSLASLSMAPLSIFFGFKR